MRGERIVIVGAGQAGARAAEALRHAKFPGAITLVGEEAEPPYERPPLSKDVLTGAQPEAGVILHAAGFYEDAAIELRLRTRVEAILPAERSIKSAGGGEIEYSKLLLCTGSRPRLLPGPSRLPAGVHYLRTLQDCRALSRELLPGRTLVAVGGGFIGLEVASSAVKLGLKAVVLERASALLDRVLPLEIAARIEALHRSSNVDVKLGATVAAIGGAGRVEAVELADGTLVPADIVVIGIGVIPNAELAAAAGATVLDGIVVDEFGETSLGGIYAAGDVTNHPNPILKRRLRLESWQNAQNQAAAVARNMLGAQAAYAEVPWFWSDQLGHNLQICGAATPDAEIVWRGDARSNRWLAFALESGKPTAAVAFNAGREVRFARALIEQGLPVESRRLGDVATSLKEIVEEAETPRRHAAPLG
jgi:3-phenylpropionate/trans-cinnamate dioxygenase ferredoxin reductase subunit